MNYKFGNYLLGSKIHCASYFVFIKDKLLIKYYQNSCQGKEKEEKGLMIEELFIHYFLFHKEHIALCLETHPMQDDQKPVLFAFQFFSSRFQKERSRLDKRLLFP